MEAMGLLLFVACVFQVILFFKLWGMTNDVRKLTKHFVADTTAKTDIGTENGYKVGDNVKIGDKVGVIHSLTPNGCECLIGNKLKVCKWDDISPTFD